MRIAVDYDTVISTDTHLWNGVLDRLTRQKNTDVTVVCTSGLEEKATAFNAGRAKLVVAPPMQMQDFLGADIWIVGRPDRVISEASLQMLVGDLNLL